MLIKSKIHSSGGFGSCPQTAKLQENFLFVLCHPLALDCTFTRFHCRIARNIRRKPSPLAPKMKLTPANGSKSAENSGR
jgi:hypothetical protein